MFNQVRYKNVKNKDGGGLNVTEVGFNPTNIYSLVDISSLDSYSTVVVDVSYCVRSRFGCRHLTGDFVFVANNVYIVIDGVLVFNSFVIFSRVIAKCLILFSVVHCVPINDSRHVEYHISSEDELTRRRL